MGKPPLGIRLKDLLWSLKENKKAQIWIMVGVVFVLLGVLGVSLYLVNTSDRGMTGDENLDTVSIDIDGNIDPAAPGQRFIDGVTVSYGVENLLPIAVMIENLVTIRPQAGLQGANVVYEALAEGGITRFMAVYATDEEFNEIGPVRSARHYYVDWAEEYQGVYMHCGGSPQGLGQLYGNEFIIQDINQIGGDHGYFWRDNTLPAPHNLFTSSELLTFALRDKELEDKIGTYKPWKFGTESTTGERPTEEKTIKIPFSSASYDVEYKYDEIENVYLRSNGGVEHIDRLTNEQIRVKNIVVQYAASSLLESDSGRIDIETEGEGKMILFRDGQVFEGSWRKEAREERTIFYSDGGEEMVFTPGNIWIEVLPDDRSVEYN